MPPEVPRAAPHVGLIVCACSCFRCADTDSHSGGAPLAQPVPEIEASQEDDAESWVITPLEVPHETEPPKRRRRRPSRLMPTPGCDAAPKVEAEPEVIAEVTMPAPAPIHRQPVVSDRFAAFGAHSYRYVPGL